MNIRERIAEILAAEAAARGATLVSVVARVQANAAALSLLEAQIAGVAGRHKDAVRAYPSTTEGEAAALVYDWSSGWPTP